MTAVVVFPQSGYANRLQAIASAAILAESIHATWHVCWEPQAVAPTPAGQIFDHRLVAEHFLSAEEARERWGLVRSELPLYLTASLDGRRVVVAGHDRGEQSLMPDLRECLVAQEPKVIVIVAGGKFDLRGDATLTSNQAQAFRGKRYEQYQRLRFSAAIEDAAEESATRHTPLVGLHLRYSDRSQEAPWRHRIWPALRTVVHDSGSDRVFVASDRARERERWLSYLTKQGLQPWTVRPESFDRSDPLSAVGALVDWRILTRSAGMVYFAASSFAEEAAVASGAFDRSIGLGASSTRAAVVRARTYATAAVTYPARHGWWGSRVMEQ
jgi:hypothetical protein